MLDAINKNNYIKKTMVKRYSSVHINESKAIRGKNFVDFLREYLS